MEYGQIILGVVLIAAVASLAVAIFSRWKQSRTPSPQPSPEQATRQWVEREAREADRKDATSTR